MQSPLKFLSYGTLVVALLVIAACGSTTKITEHNYQLKTTPPNGIEIRRGFYADQTEISNFNWMEYLSWLEKVHGSHSVTFKAALPDTGAWLKVGSCLEPYRQHYLRHPAYRNFPVVGVSQQQALDFSAWRSDRVFEFLLIRLGKITWDENPSPATHFTISRYFHDSLTTALQGDKVAYYPEFRLPEPNEILELQAYAGHYTQPEQLAKQTIPCINGDLSLAPLASVSPYKRRSPKKIIYHVQSNVSEWTSAPYTAAGENWHSTFESDTFTLSEPNAWTGFRNVCEWKRWEK